MFSGFRSLFDIFDNFKGLKRDYEPVDYLMFVEIIDSRKNLPHDLCSLVFVQGSLLDHPLEKLPSGVKLAHQIEIALVFIKLYYFHDVGMVLGNESRKMIEILNFTRLLRISTSVINLLCWFLLISSLRMILTALLNPVFLWTALKTCPKAP